MKCWCPFCERIENHFCCKYDNPHSWYSDPCELADGCVDLDKAEFVLREIWLH